MDENRLAAIERRLNASADRDWWTVLVTDDLELTPDDVRALLAAVRARGKPVAVVTDLHFADGTDREWLTAGFIGNARAHVGDKLYLAPPTVADDRRGEPVALRFAALVMEECAKVCDNLCADYTREGAEVCAASIRERKPK